MDLVALPAFSDNVVWMLHDGRQALVVDPGDAAPVHAALDEHGLDLAGILVTHHHADHVGGLLALAARCRGPILGPADEPMPLSVRPVVDGDRPRLMGLDWQVLRVPGHTSGHLAFFAEPPGQSPLLFCGDTLFSAGCGRLFEGTPAQMHGSLQRLAALPDATRVCCAHEYTLSNLRFAAAVEPANADVREHLDHCTALRARGALTLPAELGRERRINPFLRCTEPTVIAAARLQGAPADDPVNVFATLRTWKNGFR
jgi:hydroxyacylglutathione hydrolase